MLYPAAEWLMSAGDGWVVRVRCSDRSHGDFGPNGDALEQRRQAFMTGTWTWMCQQHGADVVTVTASGRCVGANADGMVTTEPSAVLAVSTADCAPVVVAGHRAVGIAHAGWRGMLVGVIPAVVNAVRALAPPIVEGSVPVVLSAALGPVIRRAHYEFDDVSRLTEVASAVGGDVAAVTEWGTQALDMAAAVRHALRSAGVDAFYDRRLDTADEHFFSHRLRNEPARQVTAVRLEPRR